MFTLAIRTDNAAFEDDVPCEVARILRSVAEAIEHGTSGAPLHDTNGNQVGAEGGLLETWAYASDAKLYGQCGGRIDYHARSSTKINCSSKIGADHSSAKEIWTMLDRIEKSAFRRGEYVGYADGAWRIARRERAGGWVARHTVDASRKFLFARTLQAMNERLAAFERVGA